MDAEQRVESVATFVKILNFLKTAVSKVNDYTPGVNESFDRGQYAKHLLMIELDEKIDVRTMMADFYPLVLFLGVESGHNIKRGDIDPTDKFPDSPCPLRMQSIPESFRKLMGELYQEGMEVVNVR